MNACFTIATNKFLTQAITLGKSFLEHNVDSSFTIILLDVLKNNFFKSDLLYPIIIVEAHKLEIDGFNEMISKYNAFEMSCALKPFAAEYIANKNKGKQILYLDSDIFVFNSFKYLSALEQYSFILTPHCLNSSVPDYDSKMDRSILKYGLFNAGFFAFNTKNKESFAILNWWKRKLMFECTVDLNNCRYVDQLWLNLLPVYFNNVNILKNMGFNVAVWNLKERKITTSSNKYFINNECELVFFHFSGYDINKTSIISNNHNLYSFEDRPDIIPIFRDYNNSLKKNKVFINDNEANYYKSEDTEKIKNNNKLFLLLRFIKQKIITKISNL